MRIQLINGVRPFERAARARKLVFQGKGVASLSLPSVAALIPLRHHVVMQDEQVSPLDLDVEMDLAMLTAKTFFAPRAYEIARRLRSKGVPVVIGGPHASLNPEEAAEHCTSVVIGEAESVMPELLADAEVGRLQPFYRGSPTDLSSLPWPRRDILPKPYIIDAMNVSRGCSHNCKFCYVSEVYGPGYRTRRVGDVVEEIRGLGPYLGFHDNNLVGDFDFARELFSALVPLRRQWITQASVDIIEEPGLIELAARAGARGFFFGFETFNPSILRAQNKRHNDVHRYRALVEECHRHGVLVGMGLVFGLDGDTPSTFPETLEVVHRLNADLLYTHVATPYPGTPFFARLDAQGRILTRDWTYYDNRFPTFSPRDMTARQLFEGTCWLNEQFYSLKAIASRVGQYRQLSMPLWACLNMNRQERADVKVARAVGEAYLKSLCL